MLVSGIKSKPVYEPLQPDLTGTRHLLIAHGEGGERIQRLYAALAPHTDNIEIYYARESQQHYSAADALMELPVGRIRIYDRWKEMAQDLRDVLATARMGMRLYLAGTEPFLWGLSGLAQEYGLTADEIRRELADSRARRVYCVHCKGFSEDVTTNIVRCPHCELHLLVRDHFSRRLNAYMGVCVDAEQPGELPPVEEIYSHG